MEPTTRSLKSGSDTRGHDKSVETEHRIVIFVQYNSTINFLENNFCRKFYPNLRYLRLDRKNKAKERKKLFMHSTATENTLFFSQLLELGVGH